MGLVCFWGVGDETWFNARSSGAISARVAEFARFLPNGHTAEITPITSIPYKCIAMLTSEYKPERRRASFRA